MIIFFAAFRMIIKVRECMTNPNRKKDKKLTNGAR